MKITNYRFGTIEIDGTPHTKDLIISSGKVIDNWRRKEGHKLQEEDIATIIEEKPDVLVVGTGYFGRMTIPPETRRTLEAHGIVLKAAKTGDAAETFNKLQQQCARAAAAFHLTC
jgi:hypothetical protein